MGIGDTIEKKPSVALIQISEEYPRQKPTVVIKNRDTLMDVEITTKWTDSFTISHIVKALEKKVEELV